MKNIAYIPTQQNIEDAWKYVCKYQTIVLIITDHATNVLMPYTAQISFKFSYIFIPPASFHLTNDLKNRKWVEKDQSKSQQVDMAAMFLWNFNWVA